MPSEQPQIDSAIDIKTAENIAFAYRTAGPFRRGVAFGIDYAIRVFVFVAAGIVLGILGILTGGVLSSVGMFFFLLLWFITECFYGAMFETFMNGQTPGKWILGVRVVTREGQPINAMQAVLRNLFRWVDMSPPVYIWFEGANQYIPFNITCLVALITMAIDPRFRRLGDLVAGTMVVVNERNWLIGMAKLDDPRAMKLAAYIPADFEVNRTMGQSLAAYVERRRFFSEARRREIARYLGSPLVRLFGFPADTSHDLLLCALYYRKFVADAGQEGRDGGSMLEGTAIAAPNYPNQPYPQQYPAAQAYAAQGYSGQGNPVQAYAAPNYVAPQGHPQPMPVNPFIQAQVGPSQPPMPQYYSPPAPPPDSASTFLPPR
jgi:uncharacterized RDD family membrane protein YckC